MLEQRLLQQSIDVENFHRLANEEHFPALIDAIVKLRRVLYSFRKNNFFGVPAHRRLYVDRLYCEYLNTFFHPYIKLRGRWVEEKGFHYDEKYYVLGLKGLLILCPENYPEHREANAANECNLIFTPQKEDEEIEELPDHVTWPVY